MPFPYTNAPFFRPRRFDDAQDRPITVKMMIPFETLKPFLDQLARLFEQMDRAYTLSAGRHGFVCNGCDENCCRTRFFHHTLLEYAYIHYGLRQLPGKTRQEIRQRARHVIGQAARVPDTGQSTGMMCPLNQDDRCMLYPYRPMICRLHGIPHILHRPDGRHQVGPGCGEFVRQCASADSGRLDRTPLYFRMAGLEQQVRRHIGFKERINLSIAQVITEKIQW